MAKCGGGSCINHFNMVCVCDGVREAGVTVSEAMSSQAKALPLLLSAAIGFVVGTNAGANLMSQRRGN